MVIVPELQVLLQRCWQVEVAARPNAVEIHEVWLGCWKKRKEGEQEEGEEEGEETAVVDGSPGGGVACRVYILIKAVHM